MGGEQGEGMKPMNFTENPDEVARRLQQLANVQTVEVKVWGKSWRKLMLWEDGFEHIAQNPFQVVMGSELGRGSYGAVFSIKGDDEKVVKITGDPDEIRAVRQIIQLREWGIGLPAFPIYYDTCVDSDGCGHILRENVQCPCQVPHMYVSAMQNFSSSGRFGEPDKYIARHFPKVVSSIRLLRDSKIFLTDIRTANVGHTMKSNRYRSAGELVIFDFQA